MNASHMESEVRDRALALYRGDVDGVVAWLVARGCTDVERNGGVVALTGYSGVRVGIAGGDPIACAASIALALYGILWPAVLPGVLKSVAVVWEAETKAARRSVA